MLHSTPDVSDTFVGAAFDPLGALLPQAIRHGSVCVAGWTVLRHLTLH